MNNRESASEQLNNRPAALVTRSLPLPIYLPFLR